MGLFNAEKRLTQAEWFDELDAPGKKLTLLELVALELMHGCNRQGLIAAGLGMDPSRNGGYLEQVRNIWDGLLKRAINQQKKTATTRGLASERVEPLRIPGASGDGAPEEGGE
jgi:hypothetical protein